LKRYPVIITLFFFLNIFFCCGIAIGSDHLNFYEINVEAEPSNHTLIATAKFTIKSITGEGIKFLYFSPFYEDYEYKEKNKFTIGEANILSTPETREYFLSTKKEK